jgi:hypothetical protein
MVFIPVSKAKRNNKRSQSINWEKWEVNYCMSTTSVSTIAYYLALIGGALMILFGLIGFFGSFGAYYLHWGYTYGGIVTIVMGIIAVIGAKSVNTLVWAIVLIIVGLIGGGLGGVLVLLGGILGLVTALSKKT